MELLPLLSMAACRMAAVTVGLPAWSIAAANEGCSVMGFGTGWSVVEADAVHKTRGPERAPTPVTFLLTPCPVVSSASGNW